jgi:hypothetical protein
MKSYMGELLEAIRQCMVETGRLCASDRLVLVQRNINYSDYAVVNVDAIHKRCKKPYANWELCIYKPKDQILWERSSFIRY